MASKHGIAAGYTCIDRITRGFMKGTLSLVSSSGNNEKTIFAMNCAYINAIYFNKPLVYISNNKIVPEIITKISKHFSDNKYAINRNNLKFIQLSSSSIAEIIEKCQTNINESSIEFIIIDTSILINEQHLKLIKDFAVKNNIAVLLVGNLSVVPMRSKNSNSSMNFKETEFKEIKKYLTFIFHINNFNLSNERDIVKNDFEIEINVISNKLEVKRCRFEYNSNTGIISEFNYFADL